MKLSEKILRHIKNIHSITFAKEKHL